MIKSKICQLYNDLDETVFSKTFFLVFIISFIYFLPFFIQDILFMDDYGWSQSGLTHSYLNIRPFGSILLSIFHFNPVFDFNREGFIVDTLFLMRILSIAILSFSVTIFGLQFFDNKQNIFFKALVIFSIIGNPYFLNMFCYKLYCLVTSTSIAFALMASINIQKRYLNIFIGTTLLIFSLGMYQISVNIFLCTSFLFFLKEFREDKAKSITVLTNNAIKLILALLTYKFFVVNSIKNISDYYLESSKLLAIESNFFNKVLENFFGYSNRVMSIFLDSPVLGIFAMISITLFCINYISSAINLKQRLELLLVFILSSFMMFFSTLNGLVFLNASSSATGPRVLVSVSILIFFVLYGFLESISKLQPKLKIMIIIPILHFFYISSCYATCIGSQITMTHATTLNIINDLEKLGINQKQTVLFDGYMSYSPTLKNAIEKNKLIKSLHYGSVIGDHWLSSMFFSYYGLDAQYNYTSPISSQEKDFLCFKESIASNSNYKITKDQNIFLVAFKDGDCFKTLK